MGNDSKVYGSLSVRPPLSWAQIRAYRGQGGTVRESLRFTIDEETQETDEGSFVYKTCSVIQPTNWGNSYGVVGALGVLAKAAPNNEFVGDITIVTENPTFDEACLGPEARRYSISEGKLYVSIPTVTWDNLEMIK